MKVPDMQLADNSYFWIRLMKVNIHLCDSNPSILLEEFNYYLNMHGITS